MLSSHSYAAGVARGVEGWGEGGELSVAPLHAREGALKGGKRGGDKGMEEEESRRGGARHSR